MVRIFKKTYTQNGFTLLELLVVIAIIGLLASVIIINVNTAKSKARDISRKADLSQLRKALENYYNDYGSYPSTDGHWWAEAAVYGGHPNTGPTGWVPGLAPNYISKLPHDSLSGTDRTSLSPYCDSYNTWWFYISDGIDYKLTAYCITESVPDSTDPYYDPYWEGFTFSIYTPNYRDE